MSVQLPLADGQAVSGPVSQASVENLRYYARQLGTVFKRAYRSYTLRRGARSRRGFLRTRLQGLGARLRRRRTTFRAPARRGLIRNRSFYKRARRFSRSFRRFSRRRRSPRRRYRRRRYA